MATAEVNGTTLFYERDGHGPAIRFVHGTFGHADTWLDQSRRFADRYACVRYDRRGYSRSAAGGRASAAGQHADDAAALIDALALAPCLVVGSSAGAGVTVDLAVRHGHLLRGVVLCEPPLFGLDPLAAGRAMAEIRPRVEAALGDGGLRAAVDAFASWAFPEGWALLDEDRRDRLRDNAECGLAEIQLPPSPVDAQALAAVEVPAMVIAGTTSAEVLRTLARRLAAALPDARFVELDSGHVPYIECPDEFAAAVSAFAADLDRRRAASSR